MSGKKKGRAEKGTGGPFEALRALKSELAKKAETSRARQAPPPPPAPKHALPPSADEEALLMHRLFAGVTPLDRPPGRVPRDRVPRSKAVEQAARRGGEGARAEAEAVQEHLRTLVEGDARFEVLDDGRRVEGRRLDVPVDLLRRLRRGRLPIDSRLDLHGMGVREARQELEVFLRTMRSRGERCVLVIHGKGEHSPDGAGVLRGEIAAWLAQGRSSQCVAAFATAADHDGGEGAVYVLLRR